MTPVQENQALHAYFYFRITLRWDMGLKNALIPWLDEKAHLARNLKSSDCHMCQVVNFQAAKLQWGIKHLLRKYHVFKEMSSENIRDIFDEYAMSQFSEHTFKSRWYTPLLWQKSTALINWWKYLRASSSPIRPWLTLMIK